jgi:hypothetical protein
MISFPLLGGILLNIGAYLTFKGKIYESVIAFLLADVCWIIMAYQKSDYMGAFFITTGTLFGVLAYIKMKNGVMHKSLNDEDEK